jgi:hypothetical protein
MIEWNALRERRGSPSPGDSLPGCDPLSGANDDSCGEMINIPRQPPLRN